MQAEPADSATALPQTASPGAGGPHSSLQSIRAAIGGSLGAVALVALAFLIWYLLRRRRHRIPRPAADFYGGEKLGGQTRTQAGGRNQQLQEVAARLTRPLTGAAQAIREAASQMKTRTGQMMREGPTTRFKSKTMPMPVVSPPLSETLVARSNQEEKTRTDTQPRLSNPFADPLPSRSLFDDNPFADPKDPFDLDSSPGAETQGRRSYSNQNADAVDFDFDTRHSNRNSSSSINIINNSSSSNMDNTSPYRISTAESSESVWSRRESTNTTTTTNTTTARPASTRSDPFDLERPPTTITIHAGGAINRMSRGWSILSRNSFEEADQ